MGEERNRMKASKFTEAQKAFVLKRGEGARRWPRSAGRLASARRRTSTRRDGTVALLPDEMRQLKSPEDENARLKKIVADPTLDREMLQHLICRKL